MIVKEKHKRIIRLIFSLVIAVFCIIFTALNIINFINEDRQAQANQVDNYIIGVYQEKIAVFAQNDAVPIEIYDVYITTLPEKDQISLRKGIKVEGKVKLKYLIEDFTS